MKDKKEAIIRPNVPLANNVDFETYDLTPLDTFGKNILIKFSSRKPFFNKKRKTPDQVIEYKPRNHRAGLGCDINNDSINFHVRNQHTNHNQIDNYYGTKIKITGGRHEGLKGHIVEEIKGEDINIYFKHNKYLNIQLKNSKEIIKIKSKYILIRCKHHEPKNHINYSSKQQTIPLINKELNEIIPSKDRLKWIQQGLLVRIINKESQYYNSKVRVEDIIDDYSFSIITNDNVIHNDFKETDCETVIPQINNDVIILSADIKGQLGKLIERNKKTNNVYVQVYDDLSIIQLTQDDICSFKK